MSKPNIRKELVEAIERELDAGHLPVEEGWLRNSPYNVTTGKAYKGVNRLWLSYVSQKNGWGDNRFCTYKQAEQKGAQVRKGAKSVKVEYFSFFDKKNKKVVPRSKWDDLDEDDRGIITRLSNVFNGTMIDGLGDAATGGADLDESEMLEICGALADALEDDGYVVTISSTVPEPELVKNGLFLPQPEDFNSATLFLCEFAKLAALALCENEELEGSKDVAAQLAAAFFTQSLGAEYELDPKQHASRILGWKKSISDKKFLKAVKEGQALADRLLALTA